MRCAIWYQLYNLKNGKNTHRGVLLLLRVLVKARFLISATFQSDHEMIRRLFDALRLLTKKR